MRDLILQLSKSSIYSTKPVGRVGIADRYQDLAILWNCLGEFSPSLQKRLFQKYGIDNPDMNKLQFHLMLDEFF